MKYEIFFLKNQSRVINSRKVGLMVRYQSINYEIKIDHDANTKVIINSIMDKNRYLKKKKYKPKIADCNIVRNKIVTDKFGYNPLTLKQNYSVTEDVLFENIKIENKTIFLHISIFWSTTTFWRYPSNILRWLFDITSFAMYTIL